MPWIIYFTGLSTGDQGTKWIPDFQNLTAVGGAPTLTGMYFKMGALLTYFTATVAPVTNTTSTAGTTYIDNFPEIISVDGAVHAVSGSTGGGIGIAQASSGRIYVPGWSTIAVPVTICGLIQSG